MAQVLLTHSYHLPFDAKQARKMQPYMPLGTLYAATALRARNISVAVFDSMLEDPSAMFSAILKEQRPKIVAVYEDDFNFLSKMCLTRMRSVAWQMAMEARAAGAATIVHGSDSTDNPSLFLGNGFDYVLCGEAEATLAQLCSSILTGQQVPEVDGMVTLDTSGGIRRNPQRLAKNAEWADQALPARDLIDMEPYRQAWLREHGYFSTNMVASRGCPFRCNWCAKPISGNRFQLRPAQVVAEEMKMLKTQFGAHHIWFGDDIFALDRHWLHEFAQEVSRLNGGLPFKIQSRADLMSEENVASLKLAGCAEVWMGVESGSQRILDAMDKGLSIASVIAARRRLRDASIRACFFLQFGYPGETWDDLRQTIDLVREVRPDDVGISFSYPLPGTVFHERVVAQLGPKRNWTDSDDLCVMFNAAYSTEFYRAVRDALHLEVDSWHQRPISTEQHCRIDAMWRAVEAMEPLSRTADSLGAFPIPSMDAPYAIVPVEQLVRRERA